MKMKRSIDGVLRPSPAPIAASTPQPTPPPRPRRSYTRPITKAPVIKPKRRIPFWLQIVAGVPLLMITAFLIQSSVFGQLAIVVYAIVAFAKRIPSRTTFTLALLSLTVTAFVLLVQGNIILSQNFATYTFLLLVAGVLTLGRELKKEGGRIYSSRQTKN